MNTDSNLIYDVAIVGAGLAGLTASIRLALKGYRVVIFEKKDFPRHKVCGEYVSNEVLPVLESLGVDPFSKGATKIDRFHLTAPSGKGVYSKLPLGAFGLSRFVLDQLLADRAVAVGAELLANARVRAIEFDEDQFHLKTKAGQYKAKFVIGAFGKTSAFNNRLGGNQNARKKYVGVKRHVRTDFPKDLVALHNFKGGYCGVSKVEDNRVNICYLAHAKAVKKSGGIEQFERDYLWQNPQLRSVLQNSEPLFQESMAISNFTFGAKRAVVDHVFMAGDAAGMISPLCGNGMAMAIASGHHLAGLLGLALQRSQSRAETESQYRIWWNKKFRKRMWWGNRLQALFGKPIVSNNALSVLALWPSLTPRIIEKTHGDPSFARL